MMLEQQKQQSSSWFRLLRDKICEEFEQIEAEMGGDAKFIRKNWERSGGGGGEMSLMNGKVFEKVGVNISSVFGEFSEEFRKQIPGAEEDPHFFATGISLVAHMSSPKVPSVHMNTRYIVTTRDWFGGGADLNPMYHENQGDTNAFHHAFAECCNRHDPSYYEKFKKWCDEYFFIKHRNEARGVGGIFYDYVNSGNWENDFKFTQDVGKTFLSIFPQLVRSNMRKSYDAADKEVQLIKRGRYAEFNLIYDRGTKFGLMTGGNTEAILMSLPPIAKWQ